MIHPAEALLLRELATLRRELEAYPDERQIWLLPPGLPNSAGTLTLHLAGNLQHFTGAVLGSSGFVRDRPAEFARRDVPRSELLEHVTAAEAAIRRGFAALTPERLEADYPEALAKHRFQTEDFLIHLATHCAFHLGQIDYHRRVVTGETATVGPMDMKQLLTARPAEG
ncbi:MAG TPA: DinB family protein [Gemmatimonadales bacterium]|nr:DinB family protein [Gemmatimonadales bacterium]